MNGEHHADSQDPERPGPRHARGYPVEQRGRRIRWRTVTISIYIALTGGAMWVAHLLGWPEQIAIPVVAVPYWAATTAIWSRYGPAMPGLD